MRILIDDKPVDGLTPKQEKTFFLTKVQEAVKGRILSPAEATQALVARTRQWFTVAGSIGGVLMLLVVVGGVIGEPKSAAFIIGLAIVVVAAVALMMTLNLRHRVKVFTAKMAHRIDGLMPAGTVLAIDGAGLSVGPDTFAWPTLAIDTVELSTGSMPSGDTSTDIMIVERLSVAAGPKTFTLDRAMVENGMLLVDNVWRKLRPA